MIKNKKKTNSFLLDINHVAIIMDGNRRWAQRHGKLQIFGHKEGIQSIRRVIKFAISHHLKTLTLYVFSSENWNRSVKEVFSLMELFINSLNKELKNLHKNNIKLRVIGEISRFNMTLQEKIHYSENLTKNNNGLILNIAANYGGRWDIIEGTKKIAKKIQNGVLLPEQISESLLNQSMSMGDLSPVDLVIRTGGEYRISNFLLWQIAYSELYFTEILWPDFDELAFQNALNEFSKRKRRFGGTIPIVPSSLRKNSC
ncbi:Ditrans,polycis-undecaprenyl-diphosphate synthase ((2E,6E)-farnesyl-diphosphate specific) [Candidatus Ecksteinia adelgidicola]|nr:Ditrans,polycis-undecaprenyl-diphosphate synthase ((2E,6E)-farnesyl-diphosphate specific) [Candidatus Ecksteinia adelgidicola]